MAFFQPKRREGKPQTMEGDAVKIAASDPMADLAALDVVKGKSPSPPPMRSPRDRQRAITMEAEISEAVPDISFDEEAYDRESERRVGRRRRRRQDAGFWRDGDVVFEPLLHQFGMSGTQGQRKPGLGIFTAEKLPDATSTARFRQGLDANFRFAQPSLYDALRDSEERRGAEAIPTNGFDDLIKLTNEGKIWKFPIDNEQDMGPEANVSFTEHVFLDRLTRDFPKTGAARNFIDLVVNGLSRNPDMSVDEKKNYITWYKDYFRENRLMGEVRT